LRRASVVGRARMGNNPNALAGYLMRRLTWGHAPFSRWSEPEEIAKIGAGEVDLWRREVLARDNLTIIAVGPLDAASFGVLIDRSFGHLPEKAATTTGLAPAPLYPAKTIVFERPGDQTVLLMEGALTIEPAESQAAAIGNNVLGGGSDGRLGRAVRGEQGATYGISSGMGVLAPGRRTFSIRSALASDLAAAALRRVRDETDRWRHEGVSEAEAAWSRSRLAANADRGVETPGGKVAALLSMLRNGRTAEDEAGYVEALRATSTAEINRVLRERVPAPMTTLIVTPKADGLGADCVIRDVGDIETCR
jgi:zinc protease